MGDQVSTSPRERYRQQVRSEVQERAWEQIADAGASALSLKAIAKQMGMTAPALYRYYASRDDLLTELILAAYRDLADVVETAAAAARKSAPPVRLTAIAQVFRDWALADTHRYLLIYGTPVPGYKAPLEATILATRIFTPITDCFGATWPQDASTSPGPAMRASLLFWTRLHGLLSLEAAGHFTGMPFEPAALYAEEVESLSQLALI
jgi:AcrR family transcriptional regulator